MNAVELVSLGGAGLAITVSVWKALDVSRVVGVAHKRIDDVKVSVSDLYEKHNQQLEEKAELAAKLSKIETMLETVVAAIAELKDRG